MFNRAGTERYRAYVEGRLWIVDLASPFGPPSQVIAQLRDDALRQWPRARLLSGSAPGALLWDDVS